MKRLVKPDYFMISSQSWRFEPMDEKAQGHTPGSPVKLIRPADVREIMSVSATPPLLVDIREEREIAEGYIEGATFLPDSRLKECVEDSLPAKHVPTILYCASGRRSFSAAQAMQDMGYRDVMSMDGGFNAWREAGYETKTSGVLRNDQFARYSRQIILGEIGLDGQMQLLKSSVLIVGAGGLGCPSALYLAAAGVGRIGLVDFDHVDLTNIHRQVLHGTADVGRPKVDSAKDAINRINPDVEVVTFQEHFTAQNALSILKEYDIVLDGSDNFETKFLMNDAAFFAGKPYVFGGAVRFDGQASLFYPAKGGPCLRCMIPEVPPAGTAPT